MRRMKQRSDPNTPLAAPKVPDDDADANHGDGEKGRQDQRIALRKIIGREEKQRIVPQCPNHSGQNIRLGFSQI